MDHVEQARRTWLASFSSSHTRRAYDRAVADFEEVVQKPLDEATRADAERFAADLRRQGVSESTINLKLSACSSFYEFGRNRFTIIEDGRERGVFEFNPFSRVKRARVEKYGKASPLAVYQAQRLLAQPDRTTERGARDYAMLLMAILTGRRNHEICQLRWRDVESAGFYQWRGKGGKERRDTLPAPVWAAIQTYLQVAGRLTSLQADDPVFTSERYTHKPLSTSWFNSMVKDHAQAAGLPEGVHAHTLRHTAAALRDESGSSVLEISRLLGHADLRTTQIYLNTMRAEDEQWAAAWALLESSSEVNPEVPDSAPHGAPEPVPGNERESR